MDKALIERVQKLSRVGFGYDLTFEDKEALKEAVKVLLRLEPNPVASAQTQADGWQGMNDDARKAGLVLVVTDEETFHTAYWSLYGGGTWFIAGTTIAIQPYKWRPLPPAPEKEG